MEKNKKILIIDDDQSIWLAYQAILAPASTHSTQADSQKQLETLLKKKNKIDPAEFDLHFCAQGEEGFKLLREMAEQGQPFALAFIDIRMPPGWDGLKTACRIRDFDPHIEIVIVTAYGDYSLTELVDGVGRPDKLLFLRKPFDPEEISQLAHSLTEKWMVARMQEKQQRELEQAYVDLKSTQQQLIQQEKMASIGLLAAGVAHEINNPVGFIASNLGTLGKYLEGLIEFVDVQTGLLSDLGTQDQLHLIKQKRKQMKIDFIVQDIKDLLDESSDGIEQIKMIVRGLKNFSRTDDTVFKQADLNECLENTIKVVWNELKYKAKVNKEYGDIPLTLCYPQQLSQVFMNLLINAAHAIDTFGDISIKTWHDEGMIFTEIADTGKGIPQEQQEKIFEPFFTTKEAGKGTGLGLSIVHDIVSQKHNGTIKLASRVGEGTCFTVGIPLKS